MPSHPYVHRREKPIIPEKRLLDMTREELRLRAMLAEWVAEHTRHTCFKESDYGPNSLLNRTRKELGMPVGEIEVPHG